MSAIVLAYGSEPWLERCVHAVVASVGVHAEVVLVDNGCTDGAVERLVGTPGVTVVSPGRNLGFAGGCNEGARHASGDMIALVNGDAVVAPEALARLASVASEPGVGIATASLRLSSDTDALNSRGNDVHFLGFSWSGGFGEPAAAYAVRRDVTGASGAGLVITRRLWEELGGFDPEYFAYHEDAELSLRCWQRGLRVVFVPDAIVVHRYEFSRNTRKYFLVERNRLTFVLTLYQRRTLLLLAPALLVAELAMVALSIAQGWPRAKAAGWVWLVRNRRWLRARRRRLQSERVRTDRELRELFVDRLDPGNFRMPVVASPFDWLLRGYWSLARRLL